MEKSTRLAFASPLPATVEAGDAFDVEVRLGNEFGLWRPADWPTVGNGETTLVASVRGGEDAIGEAAGDCLGLAGLFQRDRLGAGGGVGGGELAVGQLALALLRGSLELAFELRREFSLCVRWGL